jgi:hypothetical protein
MRRDFVILINKEVQKGQKKQKRWVDERLADSGSILSVPGIIEGVKDKDPITKQAPCEFRTFTDFVRHIKDMQVKTE